MAKKKYILSESAVRRFQKLALVKPINEFGMSPAYNRAEEMYEQDDDEDVEDFDVTPPDAPMGDVVADVEEPVMDEPDLEPEVADGAEEMARTVIQAVADALGVDIDIEGAEGAEEVPGEEVPGEEVEEVPGEVLDEDEVVTALDEVDIIDEEELTEAVMKRVVERLKGMASKSKSKKA